MLPSAADATISVHSGREDDVANQLLRSSQASLPAIASYPSETQNDGAERDNPTISARFVPGVSDVDSRLIAIGYLQMRSSTASSSCGKMTKRGCLSMVMWNSWCYPY